MLKHPHYCTWQERVVFAATHKNPKLRMDRVMIYVLQDTDCPPEGCISREVEEGGWFEVGSLWLKQHLTPRQLAQYIAEGVLA